MIDVDGRPNLVGGTFSDSGRVFRVRYWNAVLMSGQMDGRHAAMIRVVASRMVQVWMETEKSEAVRSTYVPVQERGKDAAYM